MALSFCRSWAAVGPSSLAALVAGVVDLPFSAGELRTFDSDHDDDHPIKENNSHNAFFERPYRPPPS